MSCPTSCVRPSVGPKACRIDQPIVALLKAGGGYPPTAGQKLPLLPFPFAHGSVLQGLLP